MKIFIVMMCCFCLSGLLYAQEFSPWQLKDNQAGIKVYTRKVAGSPILEYTANVIIHAPIAKALALFEDETQIPRWYYQCTKARLLENNSPLEKTIYLTLSLPWPVAPRDFIFKRTRAPKDKSGSVVYALTALPDRLPLVKGMVRVHAIRSIWRFKALTPNQTEFIFQQHTDPGGSIPSAIINQLAVETPFNTLNSFRKLLDPR